jgi:pimeloyl-ACP methyl ester carboxylesterase
MRKDICFLSGWAGYRELFPVFGQGECFHVPFSPFKEDELKDVFAHRVHARILVAWSTGAHMVLKWGAPVLTRFSRIVLVAPFLDFTRCLPVRIITRMRERLTREGASVVGEFYATCGLPPEACVPPPEARIGELIYGLEYLADSRVLPGEHATPDRHIHLVHGSGDRIVPRRAFREVCSLFPGAAVHRLACGHMVDESRLFSLVDTVAP